MRDHRLHLIGMLLGGLRHTRSSRAINMMLGVPGELIEIKRAIETVPALPSSR
jgi:hypothetical protein